MYNKVQLKIVNFKNILFLLIYFEEVKLKVLKISSMDSKSNF